MANFNKLCMATFYKIGKLFETSFVYFNIYRSYEYMNIRIIYNAYLYIYNELLLFFYVSNKQILCLTASARVFRPILLGL